MALHGLAIAADTQDYSAAERLLFMTPHLERLQPPLTLAYTFRRSGSLEPALQDQVKVKLTRSADGRCCAAQVDFFSAERRLPLPDLPSVQSNPLLLGYLEREVRELNRLTKGSQNHFRKRIRMAVYEAANVRPTTLNYRGKAIAAQEVTISPFLDDPNRPRYEALAQKVYRFVLSEAVPGGVAGILTQVAGPAGAPPLQVEELVLEGAELNAAKAP